MALPRPLLIDRRSWSSLPVTDRASLSVGNTEPARADPSREQRPAGEVLLLQVYGLLQLILLDAELYPVQIVELIANTSRQRLALWQAKQGLCIESLLPLCCVLWCITKGKELTVKAFWTACYAACSQF